MRFVVIARTLAVLAVNLVAAEDDGDARAHAVEVLVPGEDILVGHTGGDVEHDDSSLTADVVALAEVAETLLAGGVPAVEGELTIVGGESEGANLKAVEKT